MRGSLSSAIASESTSRSDSFTRRMRSVIGGHDHPLGAGHLVLLTVEIPQGIVQQPVELAVLAGHAGDRQPRTLPEVVVVDLGDGRAEAVLQLRLRRLHVLALALERPGLREVEVDGEDADVARAHGAGGPRYSAGAEGEPPSVERSVRSTVRVS